MNAGMFLRVVTVALICCTMMVGCKKGCRKGGKAGTGEDMTTGGVVGDGFGSTGTPRSDIWTSGVKDTATLQAQTVYFAYDSAAINPTESGKIQAVGDHLRANSSDYLLIEGHCDERGTAEYNRALGERRAQAVREALIGMGIGADRIQTISYGEDQPAVVGSDESAWSKNRRAAFILIR